MGSSIKFNSLLSLKKVGLMALAFGLGCLAMGFVFLINDPTPLPKVVERFLGRNPEFRETAELIAIVFGDICILSGAMLLDLGTRFLFSEKYKIAYVSVSNTSISVPNLMTGAQYIIPGNALISIEENKNSICITYRSDDGESSSYLPLLAVKDANGFITSVNELLSNQAANQADSDLQKQNLFSVIFGRDNSLVDGEERQLTLLSKLVKRPLKQLQKEYAKGKVVVKSALSKEQAIKLKTGLKKYQIDVTVANVLNVTGQSDKSGLRKKMPFIAPTFSVMTAWVIPGALPLWLVLNHYLLRQANTKVMFHQKLFILAVVMEVFLSEWSINEVSDNGITFMMVGLVFMLSAIYIAFGLKRTLENEFGINISTIKTLLFNVPYINYKTNQLIVEADSSIEQSRALSN